ncbi:S5A-REDUCTASE domain-containing protein [Mycena indigotica]|uniref:S5A-REDUCTASE domain-containing protein n=1 Tax=Mycena indigotica TaxID=2126181 RepID=A0A8H6TCZ4_9AGAR|nr:S5A-REDUCTASE domain-containing protein [Mycena indigotica]KAF7316318.1 S5A-REDUCTASE domain-containing protein [Mycena indigotica]
MAVFSRLVPTALTSYLLQTVAAAIFIPLQNEMFYDLVGCLGFLSSTFVSLYFPFLKSKFVDGTLDALPSLLSFAPRQLLGNAALVIWSLRLGSFLAMAPNFLQRAIKAGGDSRFDEVKTQPGLFAFYWFAQATWVFLVGLPVYLLNALPPALHPALGPTDILATALFAGSFLFEVTADQQKTAWRRAKEAKQHDEKFITRGLWSVSRHPNYVGEVGTWIGIWAISAGSIKTHQYPLGTLALTALSPLFTWFLLRKVSGVPPLEKTGDKHFGGDPKWEEYKRTVPVFWPWGPTAWE